MPYVTLVRPTRLADMVAGLALYSPGGKFLGVSTGPPVEGLVMVIDETDGEPDAIQVHWKTTRIGARIPS